MANRSWMDIGKDISDSVQNALNSGDLNHLSRNIQASVKEASSKLGDAFTLYGQNQTSANTIEVYSKKKERLLEKKHKKKVRQFRTARGFGIFFVIAFILEVISDFQFETGVLVISLFCFGLMFYRKNQATQIKEMLDDYHLIMTYFDDKEEVKIDDLAYTTNKTRDEMISSLNHMMEEGLFIQAHVDTIAGYFFLTDRAFVNYRSRPREEEVVEDPPMMDEENLDYIQKIHSYNEMIQDEKVSRQLEDMGNIVSQIFTYVEEHPESEGDIRKMMKYYLPTTMKLLETYAKLDGDTLKGENIDRSKREIEDTLDTINQAFSMLFDQMYEDTSMDVSSDISVLNHLLSQDGLKEKK